MTLGRYSVPDDLDYFSKLITEGRIRSLQQASR
jgi:hypothetical protein